MCSCSNILKYQELNDFLASSNDNLLKLTLEYLFNNGHCGKQNRTTISNILTYLAQQTGQTLSKEQFQHHILIPLKRNNLVVSLPYGGKKGGIFIPCTEDDIKELYHQMLRRTLSEFENIQSLIEESNFNHNISRIIHNINDEINNL